MIENELEKIKSENEHLKRQNTVKSNLISISAHQLRTSLSALRWILKMFDDKDLGRMTLEQESFIKKAIESSDRMINMVNKLLTLNHADDEDIKFNFEKANIAKILEETYFEFSSEAHKKDIEFIFLKPDSKIPEIDCDSEMIRVAFQNLIENAIKYSDQDDKIFLSIKQDLKNNQLEVIVRDTGIGIDQSEQSKIFSKFFRGTNAIEKDNLGSGLGLFTTKNIIENHHGSIRFESSLNGGTTFFITLPIS